MKRVKSIGIVCVWIALWAIAAWAIGSPVILASPYDTLLALGASIVTPAFWLAIGGTFWHIVVGLVAACLLGCAAGVAAARWRLVGELLSPAMQFIKSAPIVCFIVLVLVWFGSTYVDLAAVLLAVLPIYYFSMLEAYRQRNVRLAEMLHVFRVPFRLRLSVFEWPSVRPFFAQSTRVAVGMSWKSGVTAELIGLTFASIGEQIYMSKLALDTAGLLMWTFVIVLLSWACEKFVLAMLDCIGQTVPSLPAAELDERAVRQACEIAIEDMSKSFGDFRVFDGFSLRCEPGSRTYIMAGTGRGKSTLLNIAMGLLRPDSGTVSCIVGRKDPEMGSNASRNTSRKVRLSAVFQEERLLEHLSAEQNVALVAPTTSDRARLLLTELLGEEACEKQPSELSGGMKRCVEICRALAAPSSCVVMDEPFTGLDAEKKQQAIMLVDRELRGRTLLLVSHDRADAEALGCDVLNLGQP